MREVRLHVAWQSKDGYGRSEITMPYEPTNGEDLRLIEERLAAENEAEGLVVTYWRRFSPPAAETAEQLAALKEWLS